MIQPEPKTFMVIMRPDGKALSWDRDMGATLPVWSDDMGIAEKRPVPDEPPKPPTWYVGPHQADVVKGCFMAIVRARYEVVAAVTS